MGGRLFFIPKITLKIALGYSCHSFCNFYDINYCVRGCRAINKAMNKESRLLIGEGDRCVSHSTHGCIEKDELQTA